MNGGVLLSFFCSLLETKGLWGKVESSQQRHYISSISSLFDLQWTVCFAQLAPRRSQQLQSVFLWKLAYLMVNIISPVQSTLAYREQTWIVIAKSFSHHIAPYFMSHGSIPLAPFIYTVDAGTRAIIFDRVYGLQEHVPGEGTHFKWPWQVIDSVCTGLKERITPQ